MDIFDDEYDSFDDAEDDDLDDATEDDIDFVVAAYREDGAPVAAALGPEAANDLDELIEALRRLPGESGAVGFVSLTDDVFIAVRVRGRNVQVLLSDSYFVDEWPLARDVADFLGEDVEIDEDDDPELLGDLDIFADAGVSDIDLEAIVDSLDDSSEQALAIADRIGLGAAVREAIDW